MPKITVKVPMNFCHYHGKTASKREYCPFASVVFGFGERPEEPFNWWVCKATVKPARISRKVPESLCVFSIDVKRPAWCKRREVK